MGSSLSSLLLWFWAELTSVKEINIKWRMFIKIATVVNCIFTGLPQAQHNSPLSSVIWPHVVVGSQRSCVPDTVPCTYMCWKPERYSFIHSMCWLTKTGGAHPSLDQTTQNFSELEDTPNSRIRDCWFYLWNPYPWPLIFSLGSPPRSDIVSSPQSYKAQSTLLW